MKTLPWKKIAIGAIFIAVFGAGVFYFTKSAGSKTADRFVDPAFGEYISTYTAGVVSSGSVVRIMLAQDAVDSSFVGQESSVSLFGFKPSVSGKTIWIDRRTIEFRPEKRLNSGQVYEVSFYLSKLIENIPTALETFEYSFQVIPLNFEVSIENVKPYVKTDLKRQKIEGVLNTSDFAENASVEKMVGAIQDGKNLNVTWTHTGEGKQHAFVVENVERKDEATKVSLSVDGQSINVEQRDDREIEIPALGDFKVTNVKVEQSSSQHIVIQFSDPLNEKQNLQGLITIADIGTLDFEIRDNEIRVFPPVRQTGSKTLTVESGIKNILDYKLSEGGTFDVAFEQMNPAVRFTGKGNILPGSEGLILPFEAVNLKTVDVQIVKIFESNILQFFQVNDIDGYGELRRVGKPVLKKAISLDNSGVTDLGKWNRFTLDLSTLINAEPGAIYQVKIGFKRSYISFACEGGESTSTANQSQTFDDDSEWTGGENEDSYWDSYDEYYYDGEYDWEQRDNPCHSSYYRGDKSIKKNVLASDLGLLAKRGGDGTTTIFVNDLKTTQPMTGVAVELYDYQQQMIGNATTGADGKVVIEAKSQPFAVIAKTGNQRGYLKLFDGESLSVSNFDVGGERVNKGLKGFLYGERGVWRPGDSLFMTFVLEDKMKLLPATHPVVFELQDPQGQIANRIVRSSGENGFYQFATKTRSDAPTGNWTGRVKVGGTEFVQPVRIEMVKPNRLKINLDFGVDKITAGNNNISGTLQVNWLHGAPGTNLRAEFEVILTPTETKFDRYPDYTFEDPSQQFNSDVQPIFDGYTDAYGRAIINTTLQPAENSPGMLTAVFRGKAYEESGNFSIDRFSLPYYPYESFTGIRLPLGDKARGMLLTDTTHTVDVVTIDADGKGVSRNNVEVSISKLNWRWWWDNSDENATYLSDSYAQLISKGNIKTVNGKGTWKFKIKYPEWGRYLVKAYDPASGHSTAKIVYIDWPGWAGRARGNNDGATMLSFSTDKGIYSIGEKASIVIPGSGQGRALVSIENGSRVIESYWVETQKGDNPFNFEITREMTPNVFVHITMLQPHSQTVNDLPIRLYGVVPVQVEDPETKLQPVIQMPDVLEPGAEVVIKVSEKANRKMTYTVAMVDEGLLDLTRFKTPDPWKRFYAREALGVKTWDLYDQVMGAFGSKLERLLAIGGDEELKGKEDDAKANRFKPVVKYFGPFTLDGGSDEHRFTMPQYIGSVKTMIVAGYEGAYGSAEKATPVRKPLMVLATLPRVLGPEEKVKLPITLFSMDKSISKVKVDIKVFGPLQITESSKEVSMSGSDMTLDFDLAVKSLLGVGKVEVTATSGSFKATDVIEIDIRNPNPPVTRVQEGLLEASKDWSVAVKPVGMTGTNAATLEISSLPPINLGQRLKYLLQYPYGCIEQTTSTVFPQLYLDQVKVVSKEEQALIQSNVRAGIERLRSFQQRDGGFSYWPGSENADSWGSTYAGHFLVEAESKGYFVPNEMIKRWKKFQRNKAQDWRKNKEYSSSELIQAYRLYTLALAGDAELGAMNKLREQGNLPTTASWMLAAAYAKAGQEEAAKKIMTNLPTAVKPYQEMGYSYGSDLRDKAIILETLLLLGDKTKGFELLKDISAALSNSQYWMSTQTVAWCLKSAAGFASVDKQGELKFSYSYNGKEVEASTELPIAQVALDVDGVKSGNLKVTSESKGTLFIRLISEGTPARGEEKEEANNLHLAVTYADTDGNPIDPGQLTQGTEFIATVSIANPGTRGIYKNLALNQIFPSGWEINNLRLDGAEKRLTGDQPTYQDIRDDRVYTYFDLNAGQRKTFQVLLTATYAGMYYLPAVSCEAMYDRTVYARTKGQVVEVIKPVTQ
jgi:alpha-2-macroglobulin